MRFLDLEIFEAVALRIPVYLDVSEISSDHGSWFIVGHQPFDDVIIGFRRFSFASVKIVVELVFVIALVFVLILVLGLFLRVIFVIFRKLVPNTRNFWNYRLFCSRFWNSRVWTPAIAKVGFPPPIVESLWRFRMIGTMRFSAVEELVVFGDTDPMFLPVFPPRLMPVLIRESHSESQCFE